MHASQVRTVANAVATRALPILPGDVLNFTVSKNSLLIIASSHQEHVDGNAGQHVCGLLTHSFSRVTTWDNIWIDWKGYKSLWTIVRLP